MMKDLSFPLQKAFIEMMRVEQGMSHKGVDLASYFLLIETLKSGYGLNSKEELIFLCKKLWLKPFHLKSHVMNEKVLEGILERHLQTYIQEDITVVAEHIEEVLPVIDSPAVEHRPDAPVVSEDKPVKSDNTIIPVPALEEGELNLYISEERDVEASVKEKNYHELFEHTDYSLNNRYLPVSPRFMEQTIRSLRYKVRGSGHAEIDLPATVEEVGRKGYFQEWKMREVDGFVTRWTLLIDHEGSMAAFQDMTDSLVESTLAGSLKNEGDVFYFRNYPSDYLFTNPQQTRSIKLRQLINGGYRNILIVSDAGAARGYYSSDRVREVYSLLYRLRAHRVAWLNPLPEKRWKGSSAEEISSFVNMFPPGDDKSDHMGNIVQFFKTKGY